MPISSRILMHALGAAVIFFLFQHFILAASATTSAIWGIAGALGAGWIAWSQERRNK